MVRGRISGEREGIRFAYSDDGGLNYETPDRVPPCRPKEVPHA